MEQTEKLLAGNMQTDKTRAQRVRNCTTSRPAKQV